MSEIDRHADTLVRAIKERRPIRPLTDDGPLEMSDAYAVQAAVFEKLEPNGPRTVAKLGLTSRAKQEQMAVDEAICGWFLAGSALEIGEPLVIEEYIQPRVEPEIAFLLRDDLEGPLVRAYDVLAATEAVIPALDVLDSRFTGYRFKLPDVVADNASAARFLLGRPLSPTGLDLSTVGCVFERNGEVVGTAAGAAVLEHPAAAVAWFVGKLHERGTGLAAGSIVLAGALTAAVPALPGDAIRVTLDRLGSLDLACV